MSIKRNLVTGCGLFLGSLLTFAAAQPAAGDSLYALDAWNYNRLWIIDPSNGSAIGAHEITVESGSIYTQNGLAVDPTSGTMYAVLAIDSNTDRSLFTLDPETGTTDLIGALGYPFSAITFDAAGTLYGVTGSANYISSDSRNALFTIDPTDASLTQVCKFSSSNQGHALSFGGGLLYHASEEGTDFYGDVILETVDPASFPVDPTDPCPTTDVPVTVDITGIPVHPMSILVTGTNGATADLLLSGWHNYTGCCGSEFWSIAVDSGTGAASFLGDPASDFKGMAFHAFEPSSFASLGDLNISKISAKVREGKERHVVYTIQITNLGTEAVSGTTLTDSLDTGKLAYVSDDSGCDFLFGYQVSCDLGTIDPSETRTITIDTRVICKGKNCSSVYNEALLSLPTNVWVENPSNTSILASVNTSLKGKY